MVRRKNIKKQSIIQLVASLAVIFLVNYIGSFEFERFDLTSEKRYTLSKETKNLVKNLDDVVYIRIFLEGDFPAEFKRLQNATKEMLDEFRVYSTDNIEYEFINPSSNPDDRARNAVYQELIKEGLQPTSLQKKEEGGTSQQIIFPGAIFTYKERDIPLQLLKSQMGVAPEIMLNNSIQSLEYELANAIRKITAPYKPKIGFIEGHGELNQLEVQDISQSLSEYYLVERKKINGKLESLVGYKAIIIAQPKEKFTEKDKFVIDQFIMNGGKTIWFLDAVSASMDSLSNSGVTMGIPNDINLDDQLFRYGCRVNYTLIQDIQSGLIPINTALVGNQPKWEYFPWIFFPLLIPSSEHPIVKNLNAIKGEFVNSIDTVAAPMIKKQYLLASSKYTRVLNAPVKINLQSIKNLPGEEQFNRSYVPMAVLLQGKFRSVFTNRIPLLISEDKEIAFKDTSKYTEMIIIADGNIIRNDLSSGKAYPLGIDKYTGQEFGNKDFVMNCVDYLCDDSNLISVRSRELKIRLLDKTKISSNRLLLQAGNMCVPIAIILLVGFIRGIVRKSRYKV